MPKPILDRLREVFPSAKPFLMYGLTEAFRSTYLDPAEVDRRPDSIGKAIPDAEILVVRPDGSPCDPGEEGELVHRGPHVALGYWNDPVRTAERFRPVPGRDEPWRTPELAVWSGDTVVTDDEGFLYFVGRKDDMIKTSGYRVSPTEIEEVAYATGLVRDAVALGVEDATLGQRVLLVVAPAARGVRHRRAARGDEVPAAAVHGAQLSCGSRRDSALTQRQVRPGTVARGVGHVSLRPMIAAFGSIDGQLAVGGMPLDRLTARVGSTPYFAYDRRLLTERIELLRATLPPTLHLSYAVKANPMPAVVQHLAGLVDALDVASTLEMQTALDTPMPAARVSFAGPGKTDGGDRAGRRGRGDDRDGIGDGGPAGDPRRRDARCAPSGRGAGESRLPGEGVGHADGRRPAAVRRGRRTGA